MRIFGVLVLVLAAPLVTASGDDATESMPRKRKLESLPALERFWAPVLGWKKGKGAVVGAVLGGAGAILATEGEESFWSAAPSFGSASTASCWMEPEASK